MATLYQMPVEERVALGSEWMDQNVADWRDQINLKKLRIESGENCVLGQTIGYGWDVSNSILHESFKYGFSDISTGGYRRLNAAWKNAIKASRQGDLHSWTDHARSHYARV